MQGVLDEHDKQVQAIKESGRLSPTKFTQLVQEELRRRELLNHNKKVEALEKKNAEQETKHVRMIKVMNRLVDCQANHLRHQKFEMGDMKEKMELKEIEVKEKKELRETEVKEQKEEQERKHFQELKQMDVKRVKEMEELKV